MSETDVLEVRDLAHAIERAEQVIRERKSSIFLIAGGEAKVEEPRERDIFDALTDDTSGSAVYAPVTLTPIPPRHIPTPFPSSATMEPELFATCKLPGKPATLALPVTPPPRRPAMPAMPPPPFVRADGSELTPPSIPAAPHTAPILVLDQETFKYPAGRIPGFAPSLITNPAYPTGGVFRPDLMPLTPQEKRREMMTWLVAGATSLFGLVAIFFVCLSLGRAHTQVAATSTISIQPPVKTEAAPTPAPAKEPAPVVANAKNETAPTPAVPVYDVKTLKSAPKSRRH